MEMTIATLAHGARESLARGLEALQAVDAPPALLDVAQPVARAMGVLVEIETASDGLVAARVEPALEALREGLRLLQLPENVEHPAAARGMAAVAETLGVVVELARSLETQPASRRVASALSRTSGSTSSQVRAVQAEPMAPRAPAPVKPPEPKVVVAPASARREVVRDPNLRCIETPLGTNSPTNFFTGLSGGDVITAGGLFVATYQVPNVGEMLLLEVSLPGGYEFLAKVMVAWTRTAVDATAPNAARGVSGPPGFGARFVEINEDGRRLVQRYVKNREPLFYDDM